MLRHEEAMVCLRLERECDEKNHHPKGGDRGSGKGHPSPYSLQDDPDGDNLNELGNGASPDSAQGSIALLCKGGAPFNSPFTKPTQQIL